MKKIICLILILMIPSAVLAESIDVSAMDFDELIALQKRITLEIINRPEWKEIEIPKGEWIIGEDIPAGTYSMKTEEKSCDVCLWEAREKETNGKRAKFHFYYLHKDDPVNKVVLKEGHMIEVWNKGFVLAPYVPLSFD